MALNRDVKVKHDITVNELEGGETGKVVGYVRPFYLVRLDKYDDLFYLTEDEINFEYEAPVTGLNGMPLY